MTDNKNNRTMPREGALVSAASRPPAGVTKPKVGPAAYQAVILVLDVSPSVARVMGEINAASVALHAELAKPENKNAFTMACVAYAGKAGVTLGLTPASQIDPSALTMVCGSQGGMTNITAGIEEATRLVDASRTQPGNWARAAVTIMTDGCHNEGPGPLPAATALKANADILCVAFGAHADLAILQTLASTPSHAVRCASGSELRKWFQQVGRTMSVASRTGQNAVAILGSGGVLKG